MSNLIKSWRKHIKSHNTTLAEAVRQMNSFTRLNTLSQHIWEMERGRRDIPVKIHNYILSEIYCELHSSRLSSIKILENIKLPGRQK